jgi:hypothetical protein
MRPEDLPMAPDTTPPGASESSSQLAPARRRSFGPGAWLQTLLGLALCGYGGWMMYSSGWHSPTGFLIACVGVMIVPIGIARLLGGLGAVGLAVWLIINAAGPFDYLYGGLVVLVGGSSALEGIRTLRGRAAA